jgi:hypothetical protein
VTIFPSRNSLIRQPKTQLNKNMKNTLYRLIIVVSLPVIAQTGFSQTTILTDNYIITGTQNLGNDANYQLGSGQTRQTGTQAGADGSLYTIFGNTQTGNNSTYVGQPGGAANSAYLFLINGGGVNNNLTLNDSVLGGSGNALSVSFDIYQGTFNGQSGQAWTSFDIGTGTPSPNQAGQFGFLVRGNGGVQVFNGGSGVGSFDTAGFATSDAWTVILSGTAGGTGSPFDGTTYVNLYNNNDPANSMTGLGLVESFQLTTALTSGDQVGFLDESDPGFNESGIANLDLAAVPEPGSMALAGLGGLSLLLFRRRK